MKYSKILAILLLGSAISFYACNDSNNTVREEARKSVEVPTTPPPATPPAAEPAQNAAGVWHYICSKGCAGGGAKGDVCGTCGGPLAHNQAYHTNTNNTPNANPINPSATSPTATPPAVEPAQNAAGVWHYICNNGCAGGGVKGQNCGTCGSPLAHNQAYHQ